MHVEAVGTASRESKVRVTSRTHLALGINCMLRVPVGILHVNGYTTGSHEREKGKFCKNLIIKILPFGRQKK